MRWPIDYIKATEFCTSNSRLETLYLSVSFILYGPPKFTTSIPELVANMGALQVAVLQKTTRRRFQKGAHLHWIYLKKVKIYTSNIFIYITDGQYIDTGIFRYLHDLRLLVSVWYKKFHQYMTLVFFYFSEACSSSHPCVSLMLWGLFNSLLSLFLTKLVM